jgi:hypothetical protein
MTIYHLLGVLFIIVGSYICPKKSDLQHMDGSDLFMAGLFAIAALLLTVLGILILFGVVST